MKPANYNLPHDEFRPGQLEAINFLLKNGNNIRLLNAPTGSGKSAIAAAMGSRGRSVLVITHTRSLQRQYLYYPDFETVYGMAAYPCELQSMFRASSCFHIKDMRKCPVARDCGYLIDRRKTQESDRQVLSFAYYDKSSWPKKQDIDTLFIDEAHYMPQFVMSAATMEVDARTTMAYDIKSIPSPLNMDTLNRKRLQAWLVQIIEELEERYHRFKSLGKADLMNAVIDLRERAILIHGAYSRNHEDFYVEHELGRVMFMPLTPKPFTYGVLALDRVEKAVFASATLGNNRTFADILGIPSYQAVTVSPQFSSTEAPVRIYKSSPKVNYKNKIASMKKQAAMMAKVIRQEMGPSDHVLIHTSSVEDSMTMARLLETSFNDRVYVPNPKTKGTDQKVVNWKKRMGTHPGTIAVSWVFGTGVDAPEVTGNFVQKIPFGLLDDYGRRLLDYNPNFYSWNTANAVEQACGRTRRGEPEHYDIGGEVRKIVAIFDNNFSRIAKHTTPYFRDCIVRV